jgi:hypothetical protein
MGEDSLPRQLGDYRLTHMLGKGSMGTVYSAEQVSTGRRVALKLLNIGATPDPDRVERFRREGRMAASIADPRCVFVFAADEVDGTPFIAMEEMPGRTLRDELTERGPLPITEAVDLALQVVEGLQAAERVGVLHRDVKPSNCFLDGDGSVRVGDFGLSKSLEVDADLTMSGTFVGTPHYASPEQVRGLPLDARTDQYSLAATLYCLLTGRPPHPGNHVGRVLTEIASAPAPSLRTIRPELPRGLDRAMLRMLSKEPSRRYRDFAAVRAALLPFSSRALTTADVSIRLVALLLDVGLYTSIGIGILGLDVFPSMDLVMTAAILWAPLILLYFGVTEVLGTGSPAKRVLGLVVATSDGLRVPIARGTTRLAVMALCASATAFTAQWLLSEQPFPLESFPGLPVHSFSWLEFGFLVGVLGTTTTMRKRNGFQGIHELLSGTRVYRRVTERTRDRDAWQPTPKTAAARTLPADLPRTVGPYELHGLVMDVDEGHLVESEDHQLERRAWVWMRPAEADPLPAARREIRRSARLRWLDGGEDGSWRWDAFEAPRGLPLTEAVRLHGPMAWHEARGVSLKIARELVASSEDATLRTGLALDQVWINEAHRIRIVDWHPRRSVGAIEEPARFLASATRHLLVADGSGSGSASPPLPESARRLLSGLAATAGSATLGAALASLESLAAGPGMVPRRYRMASLMPFVGSIIILGLTFGPWMTQRSFGRPLSSIEAAAFWAATHPEDSGRPIKGSAAHAAYILGTEGIAGLREEGLLSEAENPHVQVMLRTPFGIPKAIRESRLRLLVAQSSDQVARLQREDPEEYAMAQALAPQFGEIHTKAFDQSMDTGVLFLFSKLLAAMAALSVLSAIVLRRGFFLGLLGIRVHSRGGGEAGRIRCVVRTLVTWLPAVACIHLARLSRQLGGMDGRLTMDELKSGDSQPTALLAMTGLAYLAVGAAYALWRPQRGLQDRIAGTVLVPE